MQDNKKQDNNLKDNNSEEGNPRAEKLQEQTEQTMTTDDKTSEVSVAKEQTSEKQASGEQASEEKAAAEQTEDNAAKEQPPEEVDSQELMKDYRQLKELAIRDDLTSLLNRRGFESLINDALELMDEKDICALFIIDLDNFKSINDELGHQCGDAVLKKTAAILSRIFRANDIVGRLGGDEFIAFLCGDIPEQLIRKKSQRICDHLQFLIGDGSDRLVTASVGVYMDTGSGHSFEMLYKEADQALYKAKGKGKHRYCFKQHSIDRKAMKEESYMPVNAVRLKGLFDYIDSGVAMIEVKPKAKFIYVSPIFAMMLGIDAKKLMEQYPLEFVHFDNRQELRHLILDRVIENKESVSHVTRVINAKGKAMWWRVYAIQVEYDEHRPVTLITVTDVTELKERETELQKNNELYQIALSQTIQGIWEVDLATKKFRILGESAEFPSKLKEPVKFPEELIENDWIFGESVDEFREFADEIFDGRMQGYANFLIRYDQEGSYRWASFSYRTMFDEVGRPVRAVGVIEGIRQETEEIKEDFTPLKLPEGLMTNLVVHSHSNLTQDKVLSLWVEGRDLTGDVSVQTCQQLLLLEKDRMYTPEILKNFPYYFSLDGIMQAYEEEGERWMTFEYQRVDSAGVIRWVSCVLNLYQDEASGDLHMLTWVAKLDLRRYWENTLDVSVYKDPISKLYTRSTFRDMSGKLIHKADNTLMALVLVEIGGMARLYAQDASRLEKKWQAILTALMLALGTNCVNGQSGKDRVMLFFPDIVSRESLERRLNYAFRFVRGITGDLVDGKLIRFLAVGICRYSEDADYEIMLKKAQTVCGLWSNSSGDRVVFADEENENWKQLQQPQQLDSIRTFREEKPRPLSDREKEAAFDCILEMLTSDSIDQSAGKVLETLGDYYRADRVYILVPVEYGHVITMPHEWTAPHKSSIQQAVSGTLISNFPLIARCASEDKPTFMTRKNPINIMGLKDPSREKVWHFAVFPMRNEDRLQGYLCIENAHEHETDAALPELLAKCLIKEREKQIRNSRHTLGEYGKQGTEIPSLSSYMEAIYNYNSDVYSALGAVCIDVPNIGVINDSQGYEYGRKLLWYVINSITDIFGKGMLFRTWDAEFVALCPNTTQQVFFGKCARLRAMITRRYPSEVRMGYTWADKVFIGKALVDEAKSLMRSENTAEVNLPMQHMNLPPELAAYESVGEMLNAGRFTVFLQPKFDMFSGRLVGAEALIRGLDDEGNAIPPVKFIEEIEKNGSIRDLDLFVLDRTLHLLDQWREMGYRLIPISVNFSRVTLFDARSLASYLAIFSRYPELYPELIEIEITESAGNVSQETMSEVMKKFRVHGVTFSLDDFGSQYSNLAIFTNVKFDSVKLDRSLVSEIVRNEKSQMLVQDIVQICNKGGMRCIAEGVETFDQIVALKEAGCHYAQGYYYDKPLPAEEFRKKHMQKPTPPRKIQSPGGNP